MPFSRSFGTNETQQLREGQLVGRMLLQRLATGATGVKQASMQMRMAGITRFCQFLGAQTQIASYSRKDLCVLTNRVFPSFLVQVHVRPSGRRLIKLSERG